MYGTALAEMPSEEILGSPEEMPHDRERATRAQHERSEMFVEGEESDGGDQQRDQAHPAVGGLRHQKDTGETHALAAPGGSAPGVIFGEAPGYVIGNPMTGFRGELGDNVEGEFGKQGLHAFHELAILIVESGGEGDLNAFAQMRASVENGSSPA